MAESTQVIAGASLQDANGAVPGAQITPRTSDRIKPGATIEDLVPDYLKQAAADEDKVQPKGKAKEKAVVEDDEEDEEGFNALEDEDDEPDDEEDAGNEEDEEELDLSTEAVNKLITEGDTQAVVKKPAGAPNAQIPSWKEIPEYKEISKKAKVAGVKAEDLDNLIQKVSDTSKIESSTYLQNLTKERDDLKNSISARDAELIRLKEVEREAFFDTAQETQEKYTKPMHAAFDAVQKIFNTEGINVPVTKILAAKNRTEFNEALSDVTLEPEDMTRVINYWKQHRDLQEGYSRDRMESRTRLAKQMNLEISPERVKSVLRASLQDLIKQDDFSYIRDAIANDLKNHPDVSGVLAGANKDMQNLVLAISNPVDHIHSGTFLTNLAKYAIDNADAKFHRAKYKIASQELVEKNILLEKLVREYRKLKGAAKGIAGNKNNGKPVSGRTRSSSDDKVTQEQYEKFLNDKLGIDDILFGSD